MKWKNLARGTTVFFITATITQWQPLLAEPEVRAILLKDFEFYRAKYGAKILAYVVMPDHYHMVLELPEPELLHRWLHDVQGRSAGELSRWLRRTRSQEELGVYAAHANGPAEIAVWKEQARALGITSEKTLRAKIEYIHANPVKAGLVSEPGEWPWSSWRNYYLDDDSVFRVDRVEFL